MTDYYATVDKAEKIRCRPEEAGSYLLYNPRSDQLHLVDERGKQIFDLCDGRPIDDVVREASALFPEGATDTIAQEVLDFLCALRKRGLLVMS